MAKIGTKRKSNGRQDHDGELGLIIDEMGRAMWNADKEYIAKHKNIISTINTVLTPNMRLALDKFKFYCEAYHGW